MSNERERLAREWATSTLPKGDAKTLAAIEHILATTPEPTMAGAEWSDEKHHLAGAVYEYEGSTCPVVMVGETRDGEIYSVDLDENAGFWPMPEDLTPNGKKYRLVEATGGEHPETLTTVEDYENAPVGTVVEGEGKLPWTRLEYVWKETAGDVQNDVGMAGTERRVLRWGWGE